MAPEHLVGGCPKAMLVCSLSVQGELGWEGEGERWERGGGRVARVYIGRRSLHKSVASTTSLGRQFQKSFPGCWKHADYPLNDKPLFLSLPPTITDLAAPYPDLLAISTFSPVGSLSSNGLRMCVCMCLHIALALVWNELIILLRAGIAQWSEHRTRARKVVGLNPCRSSRRIFFSRVDFLCWFLFWHPFHPRVTAVARKRPRSFRQKCR